MSIDLNWDTLTSGPEGEALAASIRDFVHTKFQAVPLPRFIKSVAVHDFEFGKVAPQVVLKDICDPLPDFYEEDPDVDYGDDEDGEGSGSGENVHDGASGDGHHHHDDDRVSRDGYLHYDDDVGDCEDSHMSASMETLGASSARTGEMRASAAAAAAPPHRRSHRDRHGPEDMPDSIKAAERRRHAELDRRRYGVGRGGDSTTNNNNSNNLYRRAPELRRFNSERSEFPFPSHHLHLAGAGLRSGTPDLGTPFLGLGASTPGIPGGMANMHYFQSKLAGQGWSGTQTPLAAVVGAQHLGGWLDAANNKDHRNGPAQADARRRAALEGIFPGGSGGPSSSRTGSSAVAEGYHDGQHGHEHHRNPSQSSVSSNDYPTLRPPPLLREKHSVSTLAATSTGGGGGGGGSHSRPPTRDKTLGPSGLGSFSALAADNNTTNNADTEGEPTPDSANQNESDDERRFREPRVDDMQAVFRIKYSGDVRLRLTAEILLDYPMPSFVGIPLKLNITGMTFDGVGVVANIRKRVHFCFLSPEDALAAIGDDDDNADAEGGGDGNDGHDNKQQHHEAVDERGHNNIINNNSGSGDYGFPSRPGHARHLSLATAVGVGLHHLSSNVGLHSSLGGGAGADYQNHQQHSRATTMMESLALADNHHLQHPGLTSPPRKNAGQPPPGNINASPQQQQQQQQKGKVGGLLQEIRVESEIGQREGTKQSLKNVGKVERFVLEQVRRIFEEELVYPSFWTFLV